MNKKTELVADIRFSEKELRLLLMVLKDAEDDRENMGCNDAYKSEEKIFTKKERMEMLQFLHGKDFDEDEDCLSNFDYVSYLIKTIKKQL